MTDTVMWCCRDCGTKYGKDRGEDTTMHTGICGKCLQLKTVSSPRDYGWPDFNKEIPDGPPQA